MRHAIAGILIVSATFGCSRATELPSPPEGSYVAGTYQLTTGETTVPVAGAVVTPAFFTALRTAPLLGRSFSAADYDSSGTPVVILSHALWTERFGGAPDVIGRQIEIDARPVMVVGIMPSGFAQPADTRLWLPRGDGGR